MMDLDKLLDLRDSAEQWSHYYDASNADEALAEILKEVIDELLLQFLSKKELKKRLDAIDAKRRKKREEDSLKWKKYDEERERKELSKLKAKYEK